MWLCPLELMEGCAGARDLPHTEATAKPGLHGAGLALSLLLPRILEHASIAVSVSWSRLCVCSAGGRWGQEIGSGILIGRTTVLGTLSCLLSQHFSDIQVLKSSI